MSLPIHPLRAALDDLKTDVTLHLAAIGWAFVFVLAIVAWNNKRQANAERERAGQLALRAYNDGAALDTSRAVVLALVDSTRLLGDSLHAVTKLATQQRQSLTGLDKVLKLERKTTDGIRVQLQALQVTDTSRQPVTTDSAGARHATFHVRQMPWTVDATATLPAGTPGAAAATLDVAVAIDAATLNVSHSCEAPNRDGIRPARVVVTAPPWLATTIVTASQDAAICPSPALAAGGRRWWVPSFRPVLAGGVGASGKGWGGLVLVHWPNW